MEKIVNIKSSNVLYIFTPPMSGVFNNQKLKTGEIRNCLLQGAYVEEVLNDGNIIRLDLTNYDKDNNPKKVEQKVVEVEQEVTKVTPEVTEEQKLVEVEKEAVQEQEVTEITPDVAEEQEVIEVGNEVVQEQEVFETRKEQRKQDYNRHKQGHKK